MVLKRSLFLLKEIVIFLINTMLSRLLVLMIHHFLEELQRKDQLEKELEL